jgi:transposase
MGQSRRAGRDRGTSDPIDAAAVARAALAHPELPAARLAEAELDLHLLVSHREDLVAECTRAQARLRWHLHALAPGLQVPPRALERSRWLDRIARALAQVPGTRAGVAAELVAECRRSSARILALERTIAPTASELAPGLLEIPGCGPLTAAKIVAQLAGIGRFAGPAQLARYAGVAPIPASSGPRQRHRLDRAGNRQLNCALYRIAITQERVHPPARRYMARRLAEGRAPARRAAAPSATWST